MGTIPEEPSPALELNGIVKRFGGVTALDSLDLRVERGITYGLLGPNGAGKTTAIRILCGLTGCDRGEVRILGRGLSDRSVRYRTGYMPQEIALYPDLTVAQSLRLFGEMYDLEKTGIESRTNELLDLVDLAQRRDSLVGTLSGGMKRRVSLACAMVHRPELLFLDEPTVGVDPELKLSFWNYFTAMNRQGITILITTHYMDEASRCATVGLMRLGRLIAEGNPSALTAATGTVSLEDAFLKYAREGGQGED